MDVHWEHVFEVTRAVRIQAGHRALPRMSMDQIRRVWNGPPAGASTKAAAGGVFGFDFSAYDLLHPDPLFGPQTGPSGVEAGRERPPIVTGSCDCYRSDGVRDGMPCPGSAPFVDEAVGSCTYRLEGGQCVASCTCTDAGKCCRIHDDVGNDKTETEVERLNPCGEDLPLGSWTITYSPGASGCGGECTLHVNCKNGGAGTSTWNASSACSSNCTHEVALPPKPICLNARTGTDRPDDDPLRRYRDELCPPSLQRHDGCALPGRGAVNVGKLDITFRRDDFPITFFSDSEYAEAIRAAFSLIAANVEYAKYAACWAGFNSAAVDCIATKLASPPPIVVERITGEYSDVDAAYLFGTLYVNMAASHVLHNATGTSATSASIRTFACIVFHELLHACGAPADAIPKPDGGIDYRTCDPVYRASRAFCHMLAGS